MKHSYNQLVKDLDWIPGTSTLKTADNPDGEAVAQVCTICGPDRPAIAGILIAYKGKFFCFDHFISMVKSDPRLYKNLARATFSFAKELWKLCRGGWFW